MAKDKGKKAGMGVGLLLLLALVGFGLAKGVERITGVKEEEEGYVTMSTREGGTVKVKATEIQSILAAEVSVSEKVAKTAEAASLYMALTEGRLPGQTEAEYQAEIDYSTARVNYMETLYAAQEAEGKQEGYPLPISQTEFQARHPELATAKAEYTIAMYEWDIAQKQAEQQRLAQTGAHPAAIERVQEGIDKLEAAIKELEAAPAVAEAPVVEEPSSIVIAATSTGVSVPSATAEALAVVPPGEIERAAQQVAQTGIPQKIGEVPELGAAIWVGVSGNAVVVPKTW